jgi:hypothetical protein
MKIKRLFPHWPVLVLFAFLVMLPACGKPSEDQAAADKAGAAESALADKETDAIVDNRSRIEATVVEVQPLKAPRFRLRLRVDEVEPVGDYPNLAEAGQVIEVYPNFVRKEGKALDPGSEENRHMAQARSLKAGDRIVAVVYRRGSRPEGPWLLMSWQKK